MVFFSASTFPHHPSPSSPLLLGAFLLLTGTAADVLPGHARLIVSRAAAVCCRARTPEDLETGGGEPEEGARFGLVDLALVDHHEGGIGEGAWGSGQSCCVNDEEDDRGIIHHGGVDGENNFS